MMNISVPLLLLAILKLNVLCVAYLDPISGQKMGPQAFPPWSEELLYVDRDMIVYNKPPNMLSVPGVYEKDSLATRVAKTFQLTRKDEGKPHNIVVHRLDYHTSGIIVFARNECALKSLHAQFRAKDKLESRVDGVDRGNSPVYKRYIARVAGVPSTMEGEIDLPLGRDTQRGPPFQRIDVKSGKRSFTMWRLLAHDRTSSLLHLLPTTGRTHQLRSSRQICVRLAFFMCKLPTLVSSQTLYAFRLAHLPTCPLVH